jgi:hypothetical protein
MFNLCVLNTPYFSIIFIMENIIEPSSTFDFTKLNLENPLPLQGGSFFTKLNHSDRKLPLYIQLPKCISKHGIIKNTSTKKSYIDLLFNYFETDLLTWFENLELKCRELIFDKKDIWFNSDLALDDIENMFISPTKSYKSGKFIIIRVHIPCTKQIKKEYCIIYDENERILEPSYINENTQFIPLINIDGIKFSSKSFQLEITIPQLMVLRVEDEIKNNCMIKTKNNILISDKVKALETNENQEEKLDSESLEINKEYKENKISESLENKENKENVGEIVEEKNLINSYNEINESNDSNELKETNVINEPNESNEPNEQTEFIPKNSIKDNENKDNDETDENLLINSLQEIELPINNIKETVALKNPIEIYNEIYKVARQKAKHLRQAAIEAYLDAKNIKTKYMLEDLDNSEDELDNYAKIEE